MHLRPQAFLAILPALLAGAPGAAAFPQEKPPTDPDAPPATSIARSAHGAALVDGELWGGGPDYKVLFRDGGFELTPALGRAAPRNFPLSFELESIARGGDLVLAPDGRAAAQLGDDGVVRYAHPGGIEEHYEMRADGVEQSFVFTNPLPGAGELVVRGRLASDLAAPLGDHAQLEFTSSGLGGVRFGAVTGVDAGGQTTAGRLRYDGAAIELVLPASFVDGAAYPLVLDPLIGSAFTIPGSGTYDESRPDVAYDNGNSLFLVVWQREYSATDYDIHAQRVSVLGLFIGGLIFVENASGTMAQNPTVAGVTGSRRFLVAWQEKTTASYNIIARAVGALDGSISSLLSVATGTADEIDPDAGGERTMADDDAMLVWERQDTGIFAAQVSVPQTGNPFVVNYPTVALDSRAYRPAISKSGGDDGRLLIAYNVLYGPGDIDVYIALMDRNGQMIDGPEGLQFSGESESEPDVDGDGDEWIVAFLYKSESDSELYCRRVLFNGWSSTLLPSTSDDVTSDSVDQYSPSVAWTPGKVFVAWQQYYDLFDNDVYAKGIDPSDCGTCEPTLILEDNTTWEGVPKLASQYSGGSANDQVFATWYTGLAGIFSIDQTDIRAQRLEAFGGGSVANLGGGCGAGGSIGTSGTLAAGNPSFRVTLSGADFSATTGLLVIKGTSIPTYTCGSCTVMLTASQFSVPMFAGACSQTIPLACDTSVVGAQLDTQWVVLPTASVSCPIFGNLAVSDRLRLTIGQ